MRVIVRLLRDQGTGVFLRSQLVSEVETVCDRIASIGCGHIAATGAMRS